jgi:threonine synthase
MKFAGFQEMYFTNSFPPEYGITPKPELVNLPELVITPEEKQPLTPAEYTVAAAEKVVERLKLTGKA